MSLRSFTGWWACGWTGDPREVWLGTDPDGTAACCYLLELPDRDNTSLAGVWPIVAPARRRAGIGTELLRHAAWRAARAGRELLTSETIAGTPGACFAQARGARLGLTEIRSTLELAAASADRLRALSERAERLAPGYSLLSWTGPVPAEYLDQVAALNAAMGDAPRLPGQEAPRWDGARIRAADRRVAAMLQLLAEREPQLERVLTYNSEGSQHMMAINAELGFRAMDRLACWEMSVRAAAGQS